MKFSALIKWKIAFYALMCL